MTYKYLTAPGVPKLITEAYKLLGVKEIKGDKHNPDILKWAELTGLKNVYKADEIPWCGLYVAYVCVMADKEPVKDPLWARNWLKFGTKEPVAMLGDILVFSRGTGGHVGFYVGEDSTAYHVLGGNQGDSVSITRILKSRLLGARRPEWKIAQPQGVRVITLGASGPISKNEQ